MSSLEVPPLNPELGDPFSDVQWQLSTAKLNTKTVTIRDGDYILAYGQKQRGQFFRCIQDSTSGVLKADRTYVVSADGTSLKPEVGIIHRHRLETDEDGGSFLKILSYNVDKYFSTDIMNPSASKFITTVSNASTVATTEAGVELTSDAINQAFAQANLPGGTISFSDEICCNMWMFVSSGQNLTCKLGVGMENVAAQQGLNQRIGLDICDIANIPRNWNVVGGSGSTWSMDPSSEPVARTAQRAYQLRHTPLQNIKFTKVDDVGLESITLKTTSVPGTGQTNPGRSFTMGIKTNENTAKKATLSALRLNGPLPIKTFPFGIIT